MKYRILLLASFFLHIVIADVVAQYDNVWAYGDSLGLDFNSTPPKVIKTGMSAFEGSASICDASGQLLFYTNGNAIWDRSHKYMPNGINLTNSWIDETFTTTQATAIVPMPANENKYYVFSLGSIQLTANGRLHYCVVDLTLNGGMGDIVPGTKSTLLATDVDEGMTAVPGDQCNIWLIVTSFSSRKIKAYSIGFDGIDTVPVISPQTSLMGTWPGLGSIDISPDRSKLAVATGGGLALFDFDAFTGKAGNEMILENQTGGRIYGISFSPDNSKLYASGEGLLRGLFQYDISRGIVQSIIASRVELNGPGSAPLALRRAVDGRIYAAMAGALVSVRFPNLKGMACGYVKSERIAPAGIGLPNPSTTFSNRKIYSIATDTVYCADSFLLVAKLNTGSDYKWGDGKGGPSRYVYRSGTYTLNYRVWNGNSCEEHVDEFHITLNNIPKHYTTTTFTGKCQADTFTMVAHNLHQTFYLWEDSITTGKTRKVNQSGIYWVSYPDDSVCAHYVDSFIITYPEKDYEVSFTADTLVCENDVIRFENSSDHHFNSFTWTFGNGDSSSSPNPSYSYAQEGSYLVRLIGKIEGICPDTVDATIIVDAPLTVYFTTIPDSICLGSSLSFRHTLSGNTLNNLHWNFGDDIGLSSTDKIVQHAFDQAGALPVTLSAQFRACPPDSFTNAVYVFAPPTLNLGPDKGLCADAAPLYLKNQAPVAPGPLQYLWSTGDTTESIPVKGPGKYSLTLRAGPLACPATESVTITKDCYIDMPNVFSPNGDGWNDYFFPRLLLSGKVTGFTMQIFNRWGQNIFKTHSSNGRGWDGQCNGIAQSEGVYVYIIDVEHEGEKSERYQGNVLLMR